MRKVIVAYRYCMSCSPKYSMPQELMDLKKRLPDVEFKYYKEGEYHDHMLIICGCFHECVSFERYSMDTGISLMWAEGYIDKHVKEIEETIEKVKARNGAEL